MSNKWIVVILLTSGCMLYKPSIEKMLPSVPANFGLLLPFIPILMGWGTCKIYSLLKEKVEAQMFRNIVGVLYLIPAILLFFIPLSRDIRSGWIEILIGLLFYITGILYLFFDRHEQIN